HASTWYVTSHFITVPHFTMLSHDKEYIVDVGAHISLGCEFYKNHFNLFDNPVQWKKSQYDEISEINILGNVKEPFDSTGRFHVTYDPSPPRHTMTLAIINMTEVDSGNYTCEVSAPSSAELGIVKYTVYVKAPVEDVYIVQGNTTTSGDVMSATAITFIENEATPVRCIARGGSPPPEMEITVGGDHYTKYFRFHSLAAMTGDVGFRTIHMTTMLITDNFRTSARDDGKRFRCRANVSGLRGVVRSALITVNYGPKVHCINSVASPGDRNIMLKCDVMARPRVTSWFWMLDDERSTLSEGEVANGCWTTVTHSGGRMQIKLYLREISYSSFKTYTLVAKNAVASQTSNVVLKQNYIEPNMRLHVSTEHRPSYVSRDVVDNGSSSCLKSFRSTLMTTFMIWHTSFMFR
ncbi:hypothetical protein LSH36_161g07000, partial [Paralvinella palmiformis]